MAKFQNLPLRYTPLFYFVNGTAEPDSAEILSGLNRPLRQYNELFDITPTILYYLVHKTNT